MTSDQNILDIALHCHIDFEDEVPKQTKLPFQKFDQYEEKIIEMEIQKMLEMKVIVKVSFQEDQFISPIFTRPKKDGEHRMILNLKELNKYIRYYHFKLDTFETTLKLIKPNAYMASVDLRHAYYSVPIALDHRKYLRFRWKESIFEYTCCPNGIACAPRYFTKLMKPVYAKLRQMGHTNSGYIDDSLLTADTEEQCRNNVKDTVSVMTGVGFITHHKKSVFIPTQNIDFLGNTIDSKEMIVYLPIEKKEKIVHECQNLRIRKVASIREVAHVIGLLVSTFSAVEYGPLYYRKLEREKIKALKMNSGKFEANMDITVDMKEDLRWWIENLYQQQRKITRGNPDLILITDASMTGWGAHCGNEKIGGRWNLQESAHHINYLELLAIFYGLKSFCRNSAQNSHVQVKTDNTCAVSYINSMGGIRSPECNDIAVQVWQWCIDKNIWVSAAYLPGSQNSADFESRHFNDNIEWKLDAGVVAKIFSIWGMPEIDMFATRLNKQLDRYSAWHPDPDAEIIDAFSCNWSNYYFYAFPCFSLIPRFLAKLRHDEADCIVIAPVWITQSWFPMLMELMIDTPYLLHKSENLLTIPGTRKIHPLHRKLNLMACRLSGKVSKVDMYLQKQPISLCHLGDLGHRSSTQPTSKDGFSTVVKGRLIHFNQI